MEDKAESKLQRELESFLATLARLFVNKGGSSEVAVLSMGKPLCERAGYDVPFEADGEVEVFTITLEVPQSLYNQIEDRRGIIEQALCKQSEQLMRRYPQTWVRGFVILPEIQADSEWRHKAKKWLAGETVTNQGRVRSDSVAPYSCDGLLFRSRPEINLYKALKAHRLSFAPLPVFVRGGELYRRIEPDFVIFHTGKLVVIELDGQPFHTESPADAHARLTMLHHEGAHIERIKAKECDTPEKAETVAKQIVALVKKLGDNK